MAKFTKLTCQPKNMKILCIIKKYVALAMFLAINFHGTCYAQNKKQNSFVERTDISYIQKFIPNNHRIIFNKIADINSNGFSDVLLISENPSNQKEPRLFQILQNNKGRGFILHKNYNIVPSVCHGGMTQEPTFRSINTIKNGFVIVTSAVDFNDFYTFKYTFIYSKKYNDWIVSKLSINSTKNNVWTKKDFSYPYNFKLVKFEQATVYNTTCVCSGCGSF